MYSIDLSEQFLYILDVTLIFSAHSAIKMSILLNIDLYVEGFIFYIHIFLTRLYGVIDFERKKNCTGMI